MNWKGMILVWIKILLYFVYAHNNLLKYSQQSTDVWVSIVELKACLHRPQFFGCK